jgi:hypothetical protein
MLWALIPVLSLGLLAFLPSAHAALAERKLREQARAVVADDPALARELRIGRPDLPRQFDDGGLVDVNHVPERVLVERLGLSPAEAARVVGTRERLGGFTSAEEVCAFAEVCRTQPSMSYGDDCSCSPRIDHRRPPSRGRGSDRAGQRRAQPAQRATSTISNE